MQPDMTSTAAVDLEKHIFDKHVPQYYRGAFVYFL